MTFTPHMMDWFLYSLGHLPTDPMADSSFHPIDASSLTLVDSSSLNPSDISSSLYQIDYWVDPQPDGGPRSSDECSCMLCQTLTMRHWNFWEIDIADLTRRRRQCVTREFIFSASAAALGPGFPNQYMRLSFDRRDADDSGPLRMDAHPNPSRMTLPSMRRIQMQVYSEPGNFILEQLAIDE